MEIDGDFMLIFHEFRVQIKLNLKPKKWHWENIHCYLCKLTPSLHVFWQGYAKKKLEMSQYTKMSMHFHSTLRHRRRFIWTRFHFRFDLMQILFGILLPVCLYWIRLARPEYKQRSWIFHFVDWIYPEFFCYQLTNW